MLLLVGLGNPGTEHARQRHNVGFMAAERIAEVHGFDAWRSRFQGQCAEGRLGNEKCLILKPQTYMNESGRAVGEALRFYKLEPEDVFVLYDELDLAPGKVRVKAGGGAAGHNGIRSITAHIGADFNRIRIGIGHPGHKDAVTRHVLRDFAKADKDWLEPLLGAVADAAPDLANDAPDKFMNKVALAVQGEPEPKKQKKPKKSDKKTEAQTAKKPEKAKLATEDDRPRGAMAEMLGKLLGRGKTET